MEKTPLVTLPVPSTSFVSDPTFVDPGGKVELRYEYRRKGTLIHGGIRFEKVRAYRFRTEGHSTSWHVQAYDTLVEVAPSPWITELREAEPAQPSSRWELHHYLIYVDGAAAYDVAAASWSLLPAGEEVT